MIFVYILKSLVDKGYYIGISKDLNKRLQDHNKGKTRSTKNRKPFVLVYSEEYENYSLARIREKEIKSYKGGSKFKELIVNYCPVV